VARTFDRTTNTRGGTNERGVITGNDKDQTFYLKAGSDETYGRRGADTTYGDGGSDRMEGNGGRDNISARGGRGDDDPAFGGDGNDTISVVDGDSNDPGSCGAGSDATLRVDSRAERDKLTGCENEYVDWDHTRSTLRPDRGVKAPALSLPKPDKGLCLLRCSEWASSDGFHSPVPDRWRVDGSLLLPGDWWAGSGNGASCRPRRGRHGRGGAR
jgi:hypothetical protein